MKAESQESGEKLNSAPRLPQGTMNSPLNTKFLRHRSLEPQEKKEDLSDGEERVTVHNLPWGAES